MPHYRRHPVRDSNAGAEAPSIALMISNGMQAVEHSKGFIMFFCLARLGIGASDMTKAQRFCNACTDATRSSKKIEVIAASLQSTLFPIDVIFSLTGFTSPMIRFSNGT
jgi:hypothetical protein